MPNPIDIGHAKPGSGRIIYTFGGVPVKEIDDWESFHIKVSGRLLSETPIVQFYELDGDIYGVLRRNDILNKPFLK